MDQAMTVLRRVDELAQISDEPGRLTRTFLSPALKRAHRQVGRWMEAAGLAVHTDGFGNIIGTRPGEADPRWLMLGSHLDTVRDAGRYDGALGVLIGIAVAERLKGQALPCGLAVVGFADEEGVRFGVPFLGSRGLTSQWDPALWNLCDEQGISMAEAFSAFGLDPEAVRNPGGVQPQDLLAYLEVHIEQGPLLESLGLPLGIVQAIAGQSRIETVLTGQATHAGTTPPKARRDALCGAAALTLAVEEAMQATPGLMATVGALTVSPGISNVVPGEVRLRLDVRHADDDRRTRTVALLREQAERLGAERRLAVGWHEIAVHPAVSMSAPLIARLERATARCSQPHTAIVSGAGHDAQVLARLTEAAMLFVRSPGGISHHPDERVEPADVAAALAVAAEFVRLTAAEAERR